jgi:hypothetical protein
MTSLLRALMCLVSALQHIECIAYETPRAAFSFASTFRVLMKLAIGQVVLVVGHGRAAIVG